MKRFFSTLLILSMVLTLFRSPALAAGVSASGVSGEILTMTWNSDGALDNANMTFQQASAYADVIKKAETRVETVEAMEDIVERAVYTTLVNVDGSTLLWLCGIIIYDREPWTPLDIPYGDKVFWIVFEEMWEWDGTQPVQFNESFSDYVYINLRPEGLEFYTRYGGTDADGSVWDALYSLNNGKISSTPEWCRGWAWIDDYILNELNINSIGGNKKENAEAYFKDIIRTGNWPSLPFDWNTITIADSTYDFDHRFRAEVTAGTGYQELYTSTIEYGIGYDYPWIQLGLSEDSEILLSAAHIANHDERWTKAENAINSLNAYSGITTDDNTNLSYADVTENAWYFEAVKYVSKNGLMFGTSATSFSPNGITTRGMVVTILYRMEDSPATGTSPFPDVEAGQWYTNGVAWASINGIVGGYSNGNFGPNDAITREQLVTIIYRYAKLKNYDVNASNDLTPFTDAGNVSDYAKAAMQWAVGAGLISGKGNGLLDPHGSATRAELAAILMRARMVLCR